MFSKIREDQHPAATKKENKKTQSKTKQNKIKSKRCAKSAQIRSYFWSVFSCIQSEYRKIRTRNNSVFGYFSRSQNKTKQNKTKPKARAIAKLFQSQKKYRTL